MMELAMEGNVANFIEMLKAAGLNETLALEEGPFTIFAPTDEAFDNLPEDLVANLTSDPEMLKQVLLGHVVPGVAFKAADLEDEDTVFESAQGSTLRVNLYLKSTFYGVSF
jgi:uncharacterized surface protein with fasciclin (FAS1) repeats